METFRSSPKAIRCLIRNMTTTKPEIATFCPVSRQKWRRWLEEHYDKQQSIWLIHGKKSSNLPTITWSEAVDEALCFGWIDSTRRSIDHKRFMQFFSKRKPTSVWSKVNKGNVQRLIDQKLMTQAGLDIIDIAKQNGCWSILDDVEALNLPEDLEEEFKIQPGSKAFFLSLSRSTKKGILQWIVLAKRPETRRQRIIEVTVLATQGLKPKQFR